MVQERKKKKKKEVKKNKTVAPLLYCGNVCPFILFKLSSIVAIASLGSILVKVI